MSLLCNYNTSQIIIISAILLLWKIFQTCLQIGSVFEEKEAGSESDKKITNHTITKRPKEIEERVTQKVTEYKLKMDSSFQEEIIPIF